jgi:hypothetical protein
MASLRFQRRGLRWRTGLVLGAVWIIGAEGQSAAQTSLSAEAIDHLRKTKAPEDWTVEERLAVRFDAADVRLRRDIDQRERIAQGEAPEKIEPAADTIIVDGRKNPELMLSWELFEHLLSLGFSSNKDAKKFNRDQLGPILETLGFDQGSFWQALEATSGRILEIRRNLAELTKNIGQVSGPERQAINAKSQKIQATLCRDRVEALAKAREVFGQKKMDRLLYQGVAPPMKSVMPNEPMWREQLLWIEGGCR